MISGPFRPSRVLAALQLLALVLGISSAALAQSPRVVVVGSSGFRPTAFIASGGRWAGLSVTVLDEIAAREGWKISRVIAPWGVLLKKLESGEIDIFEGVTYSNKRARRFDFSNENLMNNWAVVYAPVGTSISSLPDLRGKTVAVSERSAHTKALNRLARDFGIEFKSVVVGGFDDVFDVLARGEADVGLVNRIFGIARGEKYGLLPTPIVFDPQEVRYAAPKGKNRELLAAIDRYLVAAKDDPASAYNRALKQWVGAGSKTEIPDWLIATVLVIALSLAIALAAAAVLRRQVRKRTFELGVSEKRFRAIFENAPLGVALWAEDGSLIDANPALSAIFGASHDELLGESIQSLTARDDLPRSMEHFQALLSRESDQVLFEKRYVRKNGEPFTARLASSVVRDHGGEFLFAMGMIEDITERKRAELVDRRLAAIVESSSTAILGVATTGTITDWNSAAEEIYGYTAGEAIGQPVTIICPDECLEESRNNTKAVARGRRIKNFETVRQRKDGKLIDVSMTISPIKDSMGNTVGLSSIHNDITERKEAEEQLRQAQKMEAVGQLTGGVAHEFNNLLMVIFGNLEMLDDRLAEDDPLRQFIAAATKGAMRGAELTQSLLAFSRKQELSSKPVDLNELVLGMRNMLQRALAETIVIETELAESLWPTSADAGQIEGALLNLSINSRDAMPEGGSITVRTSNVTLDAERLARHAGIVPGDFVMLEVADTGTGMTAEQSEHAFEPFYTTKEVGEGTGLGLSVVYGFAKQSGGFVEIDSEVGRGTSVRLCLPRTKQTDGALDDEASEPAARVDNGGTVLVVEDDAEVRALVVGLLSALGYDVVEAEDGHAALARLDEREDIDLLFTDVVLPGGMNGRDIAREGRRRRPGLKVVFTSGYPDTPDADRPEDDDGPEFVRKPYRKSELAATLTAVLNT